MTHSPTRQIMLAAIASAAMAGTTLAQSPFPATQGFENDTDAFSPTNPVSPFGLVPACCPADIPGVVFDFNDLRRTGVGMIEEIPSGAGSPFHGVSANGGSSLAVVYPDANDTYMLGYQNGPSGFIGDSQAFPGGPTAVAYAHQVDIYALPATGGETGFLWWTNSANDASGANFYYNESGFAISPGATDWMFTTTAGGQPFVLLPAGQWYHLEVVVDRTVPLSPVVHHRIYNANRTSMLYSHTLPFAPAFVGATLGGPGYNWFTVWDNDTADRLYIDNLGKRSFGTGAATIDLVATDTCLNASEGQLVVEVRLSNAATNIVGGQFHLQYDNTALTLVSAVPGDPPFGTQVSECSTAENSAPLCSPLAGLIDYSVGVSPFTHPGTSADVVMARLTFNVIDDRCDVADLVSFRSHVPPSQLSDGSVTPVPTTFNDLGSITIDQEAPDITCPANISVNADAGSCSANVDIYGSITQTFDANPTLSPTQAPGVWYTDRYAPFGFASAVFGGDERLKHSIDASACSGCRPPGFTSSFYDTQGRKYDTPGSVSMSIDLYVPAAWASTGRRMAGFWGTGFDSSNAVSGFPIIEFTSTADGSGLPRFRAWDNGVWIDLGLPAGFAYDQWQTLSIKLEGANWRYTVGNLTLTVPAFNSVQIANVILQGHNNAAGVTYDIYWDDFAHSTAPSATDNCSPPSIVGVRSDSQPLGAPFATGLTTITWTATDGCGNTDVCTQNIVVDGQNDMLVDIAIENAVASMDFTRCITFELWNCSTPVATVPVNVTFVNGVALGVAVEVPCNAVDYTCITARDVKHTLRVTGTIAINGSDYEADFTSAGDVLVSGNLNGDTFIDILDFGIFISQYLDNVGPNTLCGPGGLHADLDGDGLVGPIEYTFISSNFLKFNEGNCCGGPPDSNDGGLGVDAVAAGPITRISVKELRHQGLHELIRADLNRDGWLDTKDVTAFENGG